MSQSPKIVFFGTEDFSRASLQALIEAGFDIIAVVTKPDARSGRGYQLTESAVKSVALKNNIKVLQPDNLLEIVDFITSLGSPAGVLVSYGKIIPSQIIELFSPGIVNLHPSLLPKYRGPSPIEAAILNGELETGISIMKLEQKMDAGPIYTQQRIALKGDETKPQLYSQLAAVGATSLVKFLPLILNGQLQANEQNLEAATYTQLLSKEMSHIDPVQTSSIQAERCVRAFLGFPRSRMELSGHDCVVLKAHISNTKKNSLLSVLCSDNKFLIIDQLVAPSGKTMSGPDFLRGYS